MDLFDIVVYTILGIVTIIVGFICLVVWLIDAGIKSKYKDGTSERKTPSIHTPSKATLN